MERSDPCQSAIASVDLKVGSILSSMCFCPCPLESRVIHGLNPPLESMKSIVIIAMIPTILVLHAISSSLVDSFSVCFSWSHGWAAPV